MFISCFMFYLWISDICLKILKFQNKQITKIIWYILLFWYFLRFFSFFANEKKFLLLKKCLFFYSKFRPQIFSRSKN